MNFPEVDVRLSSIFPDGPLNVVEEEHTFKVFETTEGPQPQLSYILDKAPISDLRDVAGVSDGVNVFFTENVDYELSADRTQIVWKNDGDILPDAGTTFTVSYTSLSILSRYIAPAEEELTQVQDDIKSGLESKYVDEATGTDLDELGKIFGNEIGARRGRDDDAYRTYHKSVVQSFVSRGTKSGIRVAIAAAAGIDVSDIEVNDGFGSLEYDVVVNPRTAISGGAIETIAELADASGVKLRFIRYAPERAKETIETQDSPEIREGFTSSDAISSLDVLDINPNVAQASDTLSSSDATSVGNIAASEIDETAIQESVTRVFSRDKDDYRWDTAVDGDIVRWGFSSWVGRGVTDVDDIFTSVSDTIGIDSDVILPTERIEETAVADTSLDRVQIRDKNDYRWNTALDEDDSNWDFFSWVDRGVTGVDEVTVATNETTNVDDAVSIPDISSAENIGISDTSVTNVRNVDEYRWNETADNEEVTWNTFAWS